MLEELFSSPDAWLPALLIGCVTLMLVRYFYILSQYPPGPFPVPLFGNLLTMYFDKEPFYKGLNAYAKKYGDPFTVWLGPKPNVVIASRKLLEELAGPKRNDFAGRPSFRMGELQTRGAESAILSDFNKAWDALRKVSHLAVRKYAASEKLSSLCAEAVDHLLERECHPTATIELDYFINPLMFHIVGTSAFGETFDPNSKITSEFIRINREFTEHAANGLPSDLSPILGYIYYRRERAVEQLLDRFIRITDEFYNLAKQNYRPGEYRHFVDAILAARDEAQEQERSIAQYLTDQNLRQMIQDLFGAGEGTSQSILRWIVLLLANDPPLQEQLRSEIFKAIGEKPPVIKDMTSGLDRVNSFIQETLRCYPAAPLGIPHKTMCATELGGHKIPAGTNILLGLYSSNMDSERFPNPNKFIPDRFVEKNSSKKSNHYTFSVGPRSCLGEKMAQADIFYVTVRLLQRCKLSLPKGPGTADLEPIYSAFLMEAKNQPVGLELL